MKNKMPHCQNNS